MAIFMVQEICLLIFHAGDSKDSTPHKFLHVHHRLVVHRHIQLIEAQQKGIEAQDMEIQTLKDKQKTMEMNMNKMMESFNTMNTPNFRQPTHRDYVEEDEDGEEEFSHSRFVC